MVHVLADTGRWWSTDRSEGLLSLPFDGREVFAYARGDRMYVDGEAVEAEIHAGASAPLREAINLPDFAVVAVRERCALPGAVEYIIETPGRPAHYAVGLCGVLVTDSRFEVPGEVIEYAAERGLSLAEQLLWPQTVEADLRRVTVRHDPGWGTYKAVAETCRHCREGSCPGCTGTVYEVQSRPWGDVSFARVQGGPWVSGKARWTAQAAVIAAMADTRNLITPEHRTALVKMAREPRMTDALADLNPPHA